MSDKWNAVDAYFEEALHEDDAVLTEALKASERAGLPAIAVSPTQGKLLYLLAKSIGAKRILEVGTLGGYSAIWLARALPEGGALTTLEIDPKHAEVARENLKRAGLGAYAEVIVGPAIESLPKLTGPYDLAFIDADKQSNADYFAWALKLARPGSLIIIDNVVRGGAVADAKSENEMVKGTRRAIAAMAAEKRVEATAIQTVGVKGYDGLAIARVI
ncbi:MAG: O-methyltransferase [Hyphomonadaceae bacterium]